MEKGSAGLLCEKDGGSTRRNGELEARRLVRAPMRLCLGEPRLRPIGVDVLVFGDDRALRTDGTDGEAVSGEVFFEGEVTRLNFEGFENPSLVLDFLVGELKIEGSTFSESSSSKTEEGARRLPVDGVGVGFRGDVKLELGVMASKFEFSHYVPAHSAVISYHFACFWHWRELGVAGCQARRRAGA